MGFPSVGVVHRRRGVELAGGEKFFLAHPFVGVVWDLTVPGPRRDYWDACPSVQEGAFGRASHPVVSLLLAGQMVVGLLHRSDQWLAFRGLGRRALFDHLQR